jgi:putative transposase
VDLARKKPRFGYRRLHVLLVESGERVNYNRAFRLYPNGKIVKLLLDRRLDYGSGEANSFYCSLQ